MSLLPMKLIEYEQIKKALGEQGNLVVHYNDYSTDDKSWKRLKQMEKIKRMKKNHNLITVCMGKKQSGRD